MDADDEESASKKLEIVNLEVLSIDALVEYIEELNLEIKRVEDEIKIKKDARLGAQSIFKA